MRRDLDRTDLNESCVASDSQFALLNTHLSSVDNSDASVD